MRRAEFRQVGAGRPHRHRGSPAGREEFSCPRRHHVEAGRKRIHPGVGRHGGSHRVVDRRCGDHQVGRQTLGDVDVVTGPPTDPVGVAAAMVVEPRRRRDSVVEAVVELIQAIDVHRTAVTTLGRRPMVADEPAGPTRRVDDDIGRQCATGQRHATTIDAVAEAAGVSRKTVFTAVGGKVELLKTALDWAVAGDDVGVVLADRPGMRDLLAGDDPAEVLAGWVRVLVAIDARVGGLFRALEVAADADPDGAVPLLQTYQRQRLAGAGRTAGAARRDARRTVADEGRRRGVARGRPDAMLFDRLVRVRGWSVRAYAGWLTDWLAAQLLR